jgi:hypothetical protein
MWPSAAHNLQLRLVDRCAGVAVGRLAVKRVTVEGVAGDRRRLRWDAVERIVPLGCGSDRSAARRLVTLARVLHTRGGRDGNKQRPAEQEEDYYRGHKERNRRSPRFGFDGLLSHAGVIK